MKTKICTLKLPVIIIIRPRKAMQSLKSAGVRRCQSRSTGSNCHPVELYQTTENNSQEMAACLFSRKRRSKGHEQELREELLQSPRITKSFCDSFIWQSFIYFFRFNQWLFWKVCCMRFLWPVLRKRQRQKK